jgi:hypothetical protein
MFNKSDVLGNEMIIYLDYAIYLHFTFLVIPESHILLVWQGSGVEEPFLIFGHVSWATRIHEPRIFEASVHHLHKMRRGRWLRDGVNEINLRNPIFNHATWGGLHSLLHLTLWTSGMRTMTGKAWTIQVLGLKADVRLSSKKIMPTREMITTIRTWAIIKASRHKAIISWTKTIWAMVSFMREMRQSMRRSARRSTRVRTRRKIKKKLIMIWVSSMLKASLLNSLVTEAKHIQVISTATKYANKSFLSQLEGFFLHISHGVKGRLWIGWVVSFGGFDCCFLFVVVGARNKLRSTLLTLIIYNYIGETH